MKLSIRNQRIFEYIIKLKSQYKIPKIHNLNKEDCLFGGIRSVYFQRFELNVHWKSICIDEIILMKLMMTLEVKESKNTLWS